MYKRYRHVRPHGYHRVSLICILVDPRWSTPNGMPSVSVHKSPWKQPSKTSMYSTICPYIPLSIPVVLNLTLYPAAYHCTPLDIPCYYYTILYHLVSCLCHCISLSPRTLNAMWVAQWNPTCYIKQPCISMLLCKPLPITAYLYTTMDDRF